MKELSIEEKARRYDEALNYAKSALDCLADDYVCNHLTKDDIRGMYAKLFPELRESEDENEKIRRELIAEVKEQIDCIPAPDCRDDEDEKALKQLNSWLTWLKKQKPAEPKFKVGDWVIIDGETLHIVNVTEDEYLTEEGGHIPFRCEKDARLWNINDAKEGDILVCGNDVVIFKENNYNPVDACVDIIEKLHELNLL